MQWHWAIRSLLILVGAFAFYLITGAGDMSLLFLILLLIMEFRIKEQN